MDLCNTDGFVCLFLHCATVLFVSFCLVFLKAQGTDNAEYFTSSVF